MSRVKNCISMLRALENHQLLTKQQLAEMLETNPRNIREYKRELDEAGIPIREKRGRNGGYYLAEPVLQENRQVNPEGTVKLEQRVKECIQENCGCDFVLSGGSTHPLEPYALVHFRKSPYVIGWQKNRKNWGFLKLSTDGIQRIEKSSVFEPVDSFILIDYLNSEPYFEQAFQQIVLELDPIQEQSLLKSPPGDYFHKLNTPGAIRYSFLSCEDPVPWLISHGYICLEPESLRQSIVGLLHKQLDLYQKEEDPIY